MASPKITFYRQTNRRTTISDTTHNLAPPLAARKSKMWIGDAKWMPTLFNRVGFFAWG
jgi:hypothetical protein